MTQLEDLTPTFIECMREAVNDSRFYFKDADALVNHVAFNGDMFTEQELCDQVDNDLVTDAAEEIIKAQRKADAEATAYDDMLAALEHGAAADDDDTLITFIDYHTADLLDDRMLRAIAQDAKRDYFWLEERKAGSLVTVIRAELAYLRQLLATQNALALV